MEWNDGKERAKFENEQTELRRQYLASGMSEEQIQELRKFDEDWYRSRRREARHTQRLNITAFDEDEGNIETQSPLLKKHLHNLSTEDKHCDNDRFGWMEEIDDKDLYRAIKSLKYKDKEILTFLICYGFNVTQIAIQKGVSHKAISKKIKKFKNIFGKRLRKWLFNCLPLEGD